MMKYLFILLLLLLLMVAAAVVVPFLLCFYHKPQGDKPFPIPDDDQTGPVRKIILGFAEEGRAMAFQRIHTDSEDGLRLSAKLYTNDASGQGPVILFFHGYHSNGIPDGVGVLRLCRRLGCDLVLAEQRAHGCSQGRILTFGEKEKRDCICWAKDLTQRFPGRKLCLCGVSMGAATVLLASGEADLPASVNCVVSDCAYCRTEDILRHVIRHRGLPVEPTVFLLRLGARLFAGFDPRKTSPMDALTRTKLPVMLIHGEADRFVPCDMGRQMYAAAKAAGVNCRFYTKEGAGHALSYILDPETYDENLLAFWADSGLLPGKEA